MLLLERTLRLIVNILYWPLLVFVFHKDIWKIYDSYHRRERKWKRYLWERYMQKNVGVISLDAVYDSPIIFPHGISGIFIASAAKIGKGCTVFQQVTIGINSLKDSKNYGAPTIGDNVYIGAGAKVIGNVTVGSNTRIGANAVVAKSCPENSLVVCEMRIIQREKPHDNTFHQYLENE